MTGSKVPYWGATNNNWLLVQTDRTCFRDHLVTANEGHEGIGMSRFHRTAEQFEGSGVAGVGECPRQNLNPPA